VLIKVFGTVPVKDIHPVEDILIETFKKRMIFTTTTCGVLYNTLSIGVFFIDKIQNNK
jgi:hypothetical protein